MYVITEHTPVFNIVSFFMNGFFSLVDRGMYPVILVLTYYKEYGKLKRVQKSHENNPEARTKCLAVTVQTQQGIKEDSLSDQRASKQGQ